MVFLVMQKYEYFFDVEEKTDKNFDESNNSIKFADKSNMECLNKAKHY